MPLVPAHGILKKQGVDISEVLVCMRFRTERLRYPSLAAALRFTHLLPGLVSIHPSRPLYIHVEDPPFSFS